MDPRPDDAPAPSGPPPPAPHPAARPPASVLAPAAPTLLDPRIDFVLQLAMRLHAYGTTAQRLEGAIVGVSRRLGLDCQPWSNPTGMILSLSDATLGPGAPSITRVIRMEPGDVDLRKLCAADAIAEDVLAGKLGPEAGAAALKALDAPMGRRGEVLTAISFGLASASVAGLLRTGWADIATSAVIGLLIGVMYVGGAARPRLAESLDAIAALVAMLLAAAVASFLWPLSLKSVVIASLIVLLPGLMLTNAVNELTSQHLVSGTARFAGAVAVLMKLTFGTVAASVAVGLMGWTPQEATPEALPGWIEWASLAIGSYAFAVLFKADRRDYWIVMAAAWLGYGTVRLVGYWMGAEPGGFPAGVFVAGMVVIAAANAYGRITNRPGALVRVSGIILLVPGSVGFRSLTFVLERDVFLGLDTAFALVNALVALVAGLLFGNLLVPARRNL